MTISEKYSVQTVAINQNLSSRGSKMQVSPHIIAHGGTVYGSAIIRESAFEMNSNGGHLLRKKVIVETKWNSKTSYLIVHATCPLAAYLINIQSDEIKASVFKAIEGYICNFSDEEKEQIVHYDLHGCYSKNNALYFAIDRYKCGLDKKDENLAAELSATMIEAAADALENLEEKVHRDPRARRNISVLV